MASLPTFNASTDPTAAQWQTLLPIKVIKPSDQTVNNSATLVNDNALSAAVVANAIYHFEMEIRYSTNTTANLKTAWTFPVGLAMHYDSIGFAAGLGVLDIFSADHTTVNGFSGSRNVCRSAGTIVVGGTPGTLQLQWAQNTANVSNTTVQTNSYLILNQIG